MRDVPHWGLESEQQYGGFENYYAGPARNSIARERGAKLSQSAADVLEKYYAGYYAGSMNSQVLTFVRPRGWKKDNIMRDLRETTPSTNSRSRLYG